MWGLVFIAMVPSHGVAGAINTHRANTIFNWVIPIELIVWAAKRTQQLSEEEKPDPGSASTPGGQAGRGNAGRAANVGYRPPGGGGS
ncbi:MAG: hypothetical protein WBP81_12440 [Solirubrobacteraceae bacterium]